MTSVIRREPRIPPREITFSQHPLGRWLLRRRVDEWATQNTRDVFIGAMEAFVGLRTWARSWDVTERFQNNSISRAVPRGPALLANPADEDLLNANLLPILLFVIVREADSKELEHGVQFPQVNSTNLVVITAQVVQSLDALNRVTP